MSLEDVAFEIHQADGELNRRDRPMVNAEPNWTERTEDLLEDAKVFIRAISLKTHYAYHHTDKQFDECPFLECKRVRDALVAWNHGRNHTWQPDP